MGFGPDVHCGALVGALGPTAWRIVIDVVALRRAAGGRRRSLTQAAAVVVVVVVVVGAAQLPGPAGARGREVVGRLLRRLAEVAVASLPA